MFIILRLIKLIQELKEQNNLYIEMTLKVKDFKNLLFLHNIQLNLLEKHEKQHNLLEKSSISMVSSHNLKSLSSQHLISFTHLQIPNLFHNFNKFSSKKWVYYVTFQFSYTFPIIWWNLISIILLWNKRENNIALQLSELNKLLEVLEFKSHEEEEQLTEFLGPQNSVCKRNSTPISIELRFSCGRRIHDSIWGKN